MLGFDRMREELAAKAAAGVVPQLLSPASQARSPEIDAVTVTIT